jgi:glutamyl-tRNA reductase
VHRLVCVGLSHRTAPVELRERVGALGLGAERCPAVLEHAVLQTCYRVELYATLTTDVEYARDELVEALSSAHGVSRELLVDHLYVHAGADVSRHLSRVAAGLDSLVLGESEILGQVREAVDFARGGGTIGPGLALVFGTAIRAGRRARSETALGANPATASSMALALAAGALGELANRSLLVVGAGRIGLQTLKAAEGRHIGRVAVANRTRERAAEVAARFDATPYGLDELETALADADVAVTATASETPVILRDVVVRALAGRRARPLVLVDLAVPADVEREVGEIEGVRLFDVDDLRTGLDDAMSSRVREIPKVEAIVEEEVEIFERRYRELEVEPLLSELRRRAEEVRAREVERALDGLSDVDPAVVDRIEHLSKALVKKLLHDPTVRARRQAGAGDADEVAAAVRDLFDVSIPSDP